MNVVHTLNEKLLEQAFEDGPNQDLVLAKYQYIAWTYSVIENSVAVLSDLKARKSYVYNGGIAAQLGLSEKGTVKEINSIWEEDIFSRIHPDDLPKKHLLELQFFHFLKGQPVSGRLDYHITSTLRMLDKAGRYVFIQHRMFYAFSRQNIRLALCLYNFSTDKAPSGAYDGAIIHSATGAYIRPDRQKYSNLLSDREKEVLRLIAKGKMSKEVADLLYISINTVNRHRQNILEKLRVKNSIEAYRLAELMELL